MYLNNKEVYSESYCKYYGVGMVEEVIDRINFSYYSEIIQRIENLISDEKDKSNPRQERIDKLQSEIKNAEEQQKNANESYKKVISSLREYKEVHETWDTLIYFRQCIREGLSKLPETEESKAIINSFHESIKRSDKELKSVMKQKNKKMKSIKSYKRKLEQSLKELGKHLITYGTLDSNSPIKESPVSLEKRLLEGDREAYEEILKNHSNRPATRDKQPIFTKFYTGYNSYDSMIDELNRDIKDELEYDETSDLNKEIGYSKNYLDIDRYMSKYEKENVSTLININWIKSYSESINATIQMHKLEQMESIYSEVVQYEMVINYLKDIKKAFMRYGEIEESSYFKDLDKLIEQLKAYVNKKLANVDEKFVAELYNDFKEYQMLVAEKQSLEHTDIHSMSDKLDRIKDVSEKIDMINEKYSLKKFILDMQPKEEEKIDFNKSDNDMKDKASYVKSLKVEDVNNYIVALMQEYMQFHMQYPEVTFSEYLYTNHYEGLDYLFKLLYQKTLDSEDGMPFNELLKQYNSNVSKVMSTYLYHEYLEETRSLTDKPEFGEWVKLTYNIDKIKAPNLDVLNPIGKAR